MNLFGKIIHSTPAAVRELILFSVLLILTSCSSGLSSIYDFDYPLTNKTAVSNSSLVEIKIPKGWFVAEDNEHNSIDLWLVKDDYSATIKFMQVTLDTETLLKNTSAKFSKVVEFSKVFIKTKSGKTFSGFTNEESFELGAHSFSAFQYLDSDNRPVRTILFEQNSKFYEVSAYPLKNSNPEEIFRVQNSVLASLK